MLIRDSIAGSPANIRARFTCRIAVIFLLTVGLSGRILGQANRQKDSLHTFEPVGMNIFVPVTITGPDGRSETVDFDLDSGSNRTIIDTSVALDLALPPHQMSGYTTPSGAAQRYTTLISNFCSLSQCTENLEVLVDDLSHYSKRYRRRVGGMLAMDFLEKYILWLDFPNSQIGFLPANSKIEGLTNPKIVELISEHTIAFVEAVLPNGKTVRLMFDTGDESRVDALLYQSSLLGDFGFVQTGQDEIKDAVGWYPVRVGEIHFLKIGKLRLAPATVELSERSSVEQSTLDYGGTIGIFPFKDCVIAADYPKLELLVSAECNRDQKSKSK